MVFPVDRLTSVTDAAGKVWKYTYDETGDLTAVTDANGNTTRYAYDLMGRVIKTTNAQNASASMTYDESGNVLTATDYAGVLTTYAYDGLDRLSSKTTGTAVVSFTYTVDGLLNTVTDASGVTKYTYDSMNGLTDVQYPDSTYLHYAYDVSGRLTSVQTAYGTTGYTYDLLNRLTSVTDLTGAVTTYTYDKNGNRSSMKYANGVTTDYTYDSCNRLIQETITGSTGIVLESYVITLGAAGERTQIVELHRTVSYEYDSLYRLTKETISAGGLSKETTYTYDAMGNRLTKTSDGTVTGYTYNSLNQLTGETGITYTYDANGSQTSQDGPSKTAAYTYDQQGRLTGAVVTTGGTTTTETYQYNWSGIRTSKTTNGVKTKYLIDSNGSLSQVIAELDSAGNLLAYYTRGSELISLHRTGGNGTDGAGTGTGTGSTSTAETRYYQYDPNGSVRLLTDGTGAITDTYTYNAFGNLLAQTGTTVNSYLYNGQQYDANTGFYYLRARYMNPSTGTFISMDPAQGSIFDPVSLHKYLYANANPIMNCDPSGRETKEMTMAAVAIVGILASAFIISEAYLQFVKVSNPNATGTIDTQSIIHDLCDQGIIGNLSINMIAEFEKAILDIINNQVADWIQENQGDNDSSDNSNGDNDNNHQNLKKIKNNNEANKVARDNGYRNAEELKGDYVPRSEISKFNMMRNTKTGEIILESISDSSIHISTGLFA